MTAIVDPAAVFVDFQASFCLAAHGYVDEAGEEAMADAIEAVNAFLERYRDSGRTPIFVRTVHDEATTSPAWARKYDRRQRPMPCRPGSDGAAFAPGLDVDPTDVVVTKHRYDAFYGTPLSAHLSANGITELLVGGVATDVCVESTMRSAFDRDYDATLLTDCTAARDPAAKRAAVERIDRSFGGVAESASVELEAVDRR